eukprot:scaffold105185_cov60-Phaeocystis_antarctica.AAC.1
MHPKLSQRHPRLVPRLDLLPGPRHTAAEPLVDQVLPRGLQRVRRVPGVAGRAGAARAAAALLRRPRAVAAQPHVQAAGARARRRLRG